MRKLRSCKDARHVSQHPATKRLLLETGSDHLAEASPCDAVMGIECMADDLDAHEPAWDKGRTCSGKLILPSPTSFLPGYERVGTPLLL